MLSFGEIPAGAVLPVPFDTFAAATGAPITMTNFAVGDILVYKGTSMTQRSSTAGLVLMDTDGIDIDGITGIQGFSIDTGDNTDAGFYAVGSYFWVIVSPVTVDGQTLSFVAATFRIKAAEATAGIVEVDVKNINNVAAATPGASGGILIAGSNAATTFAGLTTGALACTTITASGAVAFQSTFAVTTSTSLAALSATTITASGAVAFQSTFAVTTSTALGALSGSTVTFSGAVAFQSTFAVTGTTTLAAVNTGAISTSGTVTFNAFTVTNNLSVGGTTTLTGVVSATAANDIRLGSTAYNAAADALLGRNVAGGSSTGRIVSEALYFLRNKWTVAAGTLTVYATDDTTSSWTATVGTTVGADPITSNDPA